MSNKPIADPYKFLFPFGATLAMLAALPWLLFWTNSLSYYPNLLHSRLMFLGFLLSFVGGFLMTAIPRMTNTSMASGFEVFSLMSLIATQSLLGFLELETASLIFGVCSFVALFGFIGRRAAAKTGGGGFYGGLVFIPLGLGFGCIGTLMLIFSAQLSNESLALGKTLLYQGFILNLIIGLGSRLIPMLSRKAQALSPMQINQGQTKLFLLQALLLNSSFFIEAYLSKSTGFIIRFLVLAFVLFSNFKIHRPSLEKTFLGRAITVASVFMVLPSGLCVVWPQYEIQLLHIMFIAGFGLLTLMVSVRVTLAHGGEVVEKEKTLIHIPVIATCLIVAMLARVLGFIFVIEHAKAAILFAVFAWSAGILVWMVFFATKGRVRRLTPK